MLVEPDDLEETSETISNIEDGVIPNGVEEQLRDGKHYAQHCAWDHFGIVWFADGKFHERVMRYGCHIATISDASLRNVVREVNDMYGRD